MTKLELRAEENSLCALYETARRAEDTESKLLILEKLTHNVRLQMLAEEAAKQEAGWGKLPTIEPLSPVMSAAELLSLLR